MLKNFKKETGTPATFKSFRRNDDGSYSYKNYTSKNIVAGDSVAGYTTIIHRDRGHIPIEDLFVDVTTNIDNKEYYVPEDDYVLSYDEDSKESCFKKVKYVMRHKCNKKMFRVHTFTGNSVDVTKDHSLMVYLCGNLFCVNPKDIETNYHQTIVLWGVDTETSIYTNIKELTDFNDYVYDIEVEDTHTFFANDILVHNTDSVYMTIKELHNGSTEDTVRLSNEIAQDVNSTFDDFMRSVCNSNNPVITTDREVVADQSFFKGKKNYMMHIVDKEEKPTDEYKITGLEIRRSDTPKIVQEYLKELVIALINDEDYRTIKSMLKRFKEDYKTRTMQEIARPMSIKVLSKYEKMYEIDGSMHGFSYHVRASLFYNSLCGPNDIKIRSGDKIGICYINHPDSQYIALPMDADVLPLAVESLEIDWKTQWSKVDKKFQKYLEAVGWSKDRLQNQVVNSQFKFGE